MTGLNNPLLNLGLNQLEAAVYSNLLVAGPGTGYAIGKRIGKQTANVYKAIESLGLALLVVEEMLDKGLGFV